MVDGEGKAGLAVSLEECVFDTKAGPHFCKSESTLDSAGTSPLCPLMYVRYKDHVIYKNIQQPIAKAVERETVGWLTNQNDEIMLIEHDRSLRVKGGGVNGVVLLKSCIVEIRLLPLQKIANWDLNKQQNKAKGEYALQPKKRKTQPRIKKRKDKKTVQTLTITSTPLGRKEKIQFSIPEPHTAAEQQLQKYIIDTLSTKMPVLLPIAFSNQSTLELAKHLLRHRTGSQGTLSSYLYGVYRFCKWLNMQPDQMIQSCKDQDGDPNPKAVAKYNKLLDDYIGELQAQGLTPGGINGLIKGIKAIFRSNGLRLELNYSLPNRVTYKPRSPNPEELQKILDIADLRSRVIITLFAFGGFREGTLTKLKYRHVKRDLENGIVPVHVHIEAEITKGKYHDYDTFLGQEAVNYLRLYLQMRRKGTDKIPPENIHDESPLIRNMCLRRPTPVTNNAIYLIIRDLYRKAGLISSEKVGRRHDLCVHSIQKFFRTQLAALNVQTDYIEYMMGHTISTFHDIEMKGIEYLRGIYAASGLSIQAKTRVSKIDALKEIIRAWGLNPEEILIKEASANPNATVIGQDRFGDSQIRQLSLALKQQMLKEIREDKNEV